MSKILDKIESALMRIELAEMDLARVIRDEIPLGAQVRWMHGRYKRTGEVVYHLPDRVTVINAKSKKKSWITIGRIIEVI